MREVKMIETLEVLFFGVEARGDVSLGTDFDGMNGCMVLSCEKP